MFSIKFVFIFCLLYLEENLRLFKKSKKLVCLWKFCKIKDTAFIRFYPELTPVEVCQFFGGKILTAILGRALCLICNWIPRMKWRFTEQELSNSSLFNQSTDECKEISRYTFPQYREYCQSLQHRKSEYDLITW
jgi:hypothetical protein